VRKNQVHNQPKTWHFHYNFELTFDILAPKDSRETVLYVTLFASPGSIVTIHNTYNHTLKREGRHSQRRA